MSDDSDPSRLNPAELSRTIQDTLEGWDIPNGVPPRISGGILPLPVEAASSAGDPAVSQAALSPLAKTLATIAERVGRGTFVFVGDHSLATPAALIPAPEDTPMGSPHAETMLRLTAKSTDFVLHSDGLPASLRDRWFTVMSTAALVAPGWNWMATLVPSPEHGQPIALGSQLGERFFGDANVVIVALTTLTQYGSEWSFTPAGVGPSAESWVQQNDARVIAYLETLSAEKIQREATAQRSASDPGALAATAAAARRRDGWTGHLVEYRTETQDDPVFQASTSYLGMVF